MTSAPSRLNATHPVLAGLTAAMYISPEGVVPNPDRSAGLYIKTRHGAIVQVSQRARQQQHVWEAGRRLCMLLTHSGCRRAQHTCRHVGMASVGTTIDRSVLSGLHAQGFQPHGVIIMHWSFACQIPKRTCECRRALLLMMMMMQCVAHVNLSLSPEQQS
jgi:hypothetical protein